MVDIKEKMELSTSLGFKHNPALRGRKSDRSGMGGYTSTTRTVDGLQLIIIHWLKNIQAASELEFGGGGSLS